MRYQLLCNTLGLATFTFVVKIFPVVGQVNKSTPNPNQTTFFCKPRRDSASGKKIPNTIAWIPKRGNVRFIIWKSELFESGGWTPEQRCQEVTKRFQKAYKLGKLHYFMKGELDGSPIICAGKTGKDVCNLDNKLFDIKFGSDPDTVVQRLTNVLKIGTGTVIQGSEPNIVLNVDEFFKKAPVINLNDP